MGHNKDVRAKYQLLKHLVPNATRGQTDKRRFAGGKTIGIRRVPNEASVQLNEKMNLEQFKHCSTRVLIQPRAQQKSHERKLPVKQKHQATTSRVTVYSEGQLN